MRRRDRRELIAARVMLAVMVVVVAGMVAFAVAVDNARGISVGQSLEEYGL